MVYIRTLFKLTINRTFCFFNRICMAEMLQVASLKDVQQTWLWNKKVDRLFTVCQHVHIFSKQFYSNQLKVQKQDLSIHHRYQICCFTVTRYNAQHLWCTTERMEVDIPWGLWRWLPGHWSGGHWWHPASPEHSPQSQYHDIGVHDLWPGLWRTLYK